MYIGSSTGQVHLFEFDERMGSLTLIEVSYLYISRSFEINLRPVVTVHSEDMTLDRLHTYLL